LFRSNPVDLVVTDHLLGREVGTDMARQMKAEKPSVPIILLSGTSSVPELLRHADAFLSKTEGPKQLLGLLENMLPSPGARLQVDPDPTANDSAILPQLLAAIVEDSDDGETKSRTFFIACNAVKDSTTLKPHAARQMAAFSTYPSPFPQSAIPMETLLRPPPSPAMSRR
jgi:DNA-binding response OmpR family regulator